MEGPKVIYIHDTESEEEALVEAVLSTPPVTRAARLREAQRQSATSNTARELFGQESERPTLGASSLRDSSSDFESPMHPPQPRPKPDRIAAARHSSELSAPDEPDAPASTPCTSTTPASTPCTSTTPAVSVAVAKPAVAFASTLATATASVVGKPVMTSVDTSSSASAFSHDEHGANLLVLRWRRRPRKTARMRSLPGSHARQTHSSSDGDSDSDFSTPEKKHKTKAKGQDVTDQRQVLLRPMFDTRMALVWKRDHYDHQRVQKTQDYVQVGDSRSNKVGVMSEDSAPLMSPATTPPARRPLKTFSEVPQSFWSNNLVPAKWPVSTARLAANFNPSDITFPSVDPVGMCNCDSLLLGDCRYQTCENARDGIFCDAYCCPFSGRCGNGVQESTSIRLMRVVGTDELTLQATERIERGVGLGGYLGELSLEIGERQNNEGFRLHYHRDYDAWGQAQVCVNARLAGSLMRFLNHSCTPGAVFYEVGNRDRRCIVATTVRVIEAGEEITADYGDDLWFECKCFSCSAKYQGGSDSSQMLKNP